MSYQVRLDNFEGPLDLLLFFIRRDELDIMDIPIARITREYLDYLEALQSLNIVLAGEFIVMAAMLMRIKARMLLPQFSPESEEEFEDPRTELVHRLLEYQRYREAARNLSEMLTNHNQVFPRPETGELDHVEDPAFYLEEVSIFELARIFKGLLDKMPISLPYEVDREQIYVKQKMAFVMAKFAEKSRYPFSEITPFLASKQELITTFLAILELMRSGQIRVLQKGVFDDFVLERVEA